MLPRISGVQNADVMDINTESMKMTSLLCACAVVITLETQNVEKEHLTSSNLTFLLIAIDRNGFRKMKEEGPIYKTLPRDLVMIFQSLVMILPRFSTLKDHN